MATAIFVVSGKVQGVFYRASTRTQALSLGVAGYAKNRVDGCVEVLATGDADALQQLQRWLWQGPPAAEVSAVMREDVSPQAWQGFHIG